MHHTFSLSYHVQLPAIKAHGDYRFVAHSGVHYELKITKKKNDLFSCILNLYRIDERFEDTLPAKIAEPEVTSIISTVLKILLDYMEKNARLHTVEFSRKFFLDDPSGRRENLFNILVRTVFSESEWKVVKDDELITMVKTSQLANPRPAVRNVSYIQVQPMLIKPTEESPLVDLNPITGRFLLSGVSMMKDPDSFYAEIYNWMDTYIEAMTGDTVYSRLPEADLVFELERIQPVTEEHMAGIIVRFERMKEAGVKCEVQWYYEKSDGSIRQLGVQLRDSVSADIQVLEATNDLFIKARKNSPKISVSLSRNELKVTGRSHPLNARYFYQPILDWLDTWGNGLNTDTCIEFDLNYCNTSSAHMLWEVTRKLNDLFKDGIQLSVNWVYYEEDERIELVELVNDLEIPVHFRVGGFVETVKTK